MRVIGLMQARLHVIAPSFNLNVYLKDAVRGSPSTKQYFIAISTAPPPTLPVTSPGVITAPKWPTKRHVRTGFLSHDPETWQSLFSVSSRRGAESVPWVNYREGFIQEANDTKAEAGHLVRFEVSCCLAGWMFLFFPIENEVPYLFSTSLHQESDIFF